MAEVEDITDGPGDDDPGQAEYPGGPEPLDLDAILLADVEPSEPGATPTEVTSEIINSFKEDWGEDESASLVNHWGDNTLANQSLTRALVEDHLELQNALDEHRHVVERYRTRRPGAERARPLRLHRLCGLLPPSSAMATRGRRPSSICCFGRIIE